MKSGYVEAWKAAEVYDGDMKPRHSQAFLEYDPAEAAWVANVPSLDHLSTFGETREAALANAREAIFGYLEAVEKEHIELAAEPAPAELVQIAL